MSASMAPEHTLPMEIIQVVFECAALNDTSACARLCLVCRTARSWMIPILYHTVILSTPIAIRRFGDALSQSTGSIPTVEPNPALAVRKLWVGPTTWAEEPAISPIKWPVQHVETTLRLCSSLRSFASISVHRFAWSDSSELPATIPPGVQSLWLGPFRNHIVWPSLPNTPDLREFYSIDAYMQSEGRRRVVLSPSMRRVRQYYSSHIGLFLNQLECVEESPALEKFEIVYLGETVEEATAELEKAIEQQGYTPIPRVVLVPRSYMYRGRYDPLGLFHNDWLQWTES